MTCKSFSSFFSLNIPELNARYSLENQPIENKHFWIVSIVALLLLVIGLIGYMDDRWIGRKHLIAIMHSREWNLKWTFAKNISLHTFIFSRYILNVVVVCLAHLQKQWIWQPFFIWLMDNIHIFMTGNERKTH